MGPARTLHQNMRLQPLLLTVLALGIAAPAPAQSTKVAPPGNSGVDEYLETVPTAGGGKSSGSSSGGGHQLPASVRRALSAQGADGRAALASAEATAPGSKGAGTHGGAAKPDAGDVREPSGESLPSAIAHALTGEGQGGMGIWLPLLLIGSALAITAAALLKRRSSA
jgi:hypothetical protein